MDVHLQRFLFHQGKKISVLLKHRNERVEERPTNHFWSLSNAPSSGNCFKKWSQNSVIDTYEKRCPHGTSAHSWRKTEICLFKLQKSASDSSFLCFQIDFFTFFPALSTSNCRHCLPFCGPPPIITNHTHCLKSPHPVLYPSKQNSHWILSKDWTVCSFTAYYLFFLTVQTSNFHNKSFSHLTRGQCLGSLYCCSSVLETFFTG